MPQFIVTSPDGKKFRINAPDGATQEQALAYAQQQFSQSTPAATKPDLKASNPGEYDPSSAAYQAKYGPTSASTFGENFTAGVGKSLVDTGRGLWQLGAMAADAVAPRAPTMSQLISGEDPSRAAAAQRAVDESARLDAPLMQTGGGITGNIAGQVAQFSVPAGYLARGGSLAARIGRGAAFGAAVANTQPVTSDQTRLGNTALGGIGGAAGEAAAAGIGKLATAASNKIAPEVAKLATVAREKWGIPLRVEQVTQSRPLAGVSAALDAVPFSGRDASRKVQVSAWNRAIAKTLGQSDSNLTTAVQKAETTLGNKYDAVLKNHPVKVDGEFQQGLADVLETAKKELPDGQFSVIQRQVDDILSKVQPGDTIDGQAAYNIKRTLDRIGRGKDPYAYHARELKDALIQALDRSLPADVAKGFAETRKQYGNLITIRKAVRAGAEGTVTPAKLATLATRGDLKELADIGATFLVEPFGNSGTANRLVGLSMLGGAGIATNVATAGKLAAGGATVGRATNALLQSRGAVNYALNGSNTLRKALPYANSLLPTVGAVASQQ